MVSAGHTNASYAEMVAALRMGSPASRISSMPCRSSRGREPGIVGAALETSTAGAASSSTASTSSPVVLRLATALQAIDRFMLVTDAMPSVGTNARSFKLEGRDITVSGNVCIDEDGRLAGSNIDMASCVRNAVNLLGVSLPEAVRMASLYPAEFLGLSHELGRIERGYRANLVLADDKLNVLETWIDGQTAAK